MKNKIDNLYAKNKDELALRIGSRLKELRKSIGLSMKQLSQETNLSLSLFSRIENGLLTPSIATLQIISEVLKVDIEYFFNKDEKKSYVINRKGERHIIKSSKGPYINELLAEGMENLFMEPFIATLPGKDKKEEVNFALHEGQEFCYVLSGKVEITLGDKKFILKKGDAAYWNGNVPHKATSLGKNPTKTLNVHLIPGKRTPEVWGY